MMRWSTTLMMSSGDSRPQWARTNGYVGAVQAVATLFRSELTAASIL